MNIHMNHGRCLLSGLMGLWAGCSLNVWGLDVTALRCEYGSRPMAVGTLQPRLSWVMDAGSRRAVVQSAYQVLVAASPESLRRNQGDLWDSGRVDSDQSVHVSYAGRPLLSGQACYWKVRVWDQDGHLSAWSHPATWTMGLLRPADWQARWIGAPAVDDGQDENRALKSLVNLDGASWVWVAGSTAGNQSEGKAFFRKVVQVPAGREVRKALFSLTADDAFNLTVNGQTAGQGSSWRTLTSLDVTQWIRSGANVLGIEAANGGPNAAGLVGRLAILFSSGDPMVVPIDGTWLSSRQAGDRWRSSDFEASDWKPAAPIASFGDAPWGKPEAGLAAMDPAPFFRKTFTIDKPIERAVVFASALGAYELHLNGSTVDTDVLSPGWTDYRKRVHYLGYDVTGRLRQGENTIGAIVGDGWYAGYLAFSGRRHYYGDQPRLIVQMMVTYRDGTTTTMGTDASWTTASGPIRESDPLMGCVYDARREMPGWDTPRFEDSTWKAARVDTAVKANLEAHPGSPIRRIQEVRARTVSEPKPGVYVFDLGQNIVGWVRLKAKGQPGQKVVVRHAEMRNPDGTLYTTNLRAAKATDTYLLAGRAARAYEPQFTFHGFQYVEVTGLDYKPARGDVTGVVVHSDLPRAGWFECSEPLVNKLTLNSLWGQKGNFLDVPTDCPQRDERAGWTGDAQVFMKTACLNLDAPGFYTKWLIDLCQDSQREDGAFGDVAPHISVVSHGNTGWSDAGPVCNWQMYQMYGDTRVLSQHYEALQRHMDYLDRTSTNRIRGTGAYGDWLRLAGPQHSEAIGTAYYYHTTRLMVDIAAALGKTEDAARYRTLAEEIRAAFVKAFIKEDGRIVDAANETGQTFYALAFGLDLVPARVKDKVARQFRAAIQAEQDHLATGFLGTPFVLFALQKAGYPELAYRLVLNKTYPSWLQQVLWGSTTMWERWDGWRPDKGFQDPGMNSFNHYWLGCVNEWLFTQAAGIDTEGPGFKRISIQPVWAPDGTGLSWVKGTYNSIRGPIRSRWRQNGNRFELTFAIPANCTATVRVPAASAAAVTEGGRPADRAKAVRYVRQETGSVVFEVGSGQYTFRSTVDSAGPVAR